MDPETITIAEAMVLLGRSEKRVRTYIKEGRLSGEIGPDGKYHIPRDEVLQLAKHPGQIQADRLDKLARRVDLLEKQIVTIGEILDTLTIRLEALTTQLDTLASLPTVKVPSASPQPRKTVVAAQQSSPTGDKALPEGAILASYFAREHGVNERTFADHCKKGYGPSKELAPVSQRPKPGREYQTEFYVLPEQMPSVLDYWRRHGVKFTEGNDEQE
jgi:hypothetical protein